MTSADTEYGGFAAAAHMLTDDKRTVTRQQVYIWWRRRNRNRFPEKVHEIIIQTRNGPISQRQFRLSDIAAWHETYVPGQGGRPRKKDRK